MTLQELMEKLLELVTADSSLLSEYVLVDACNGAAGVVDEVAADQGHLWVLCTLEVDD